MVSLALPRLGQTQKQIQTQVPARSRFQSVEKLLLSYLIEAMPGRIPGCDGMTTRQMLRGYAEMATKGLVPGYQQLERWHPEYQTDLQEFFAMNEF